MRSSNSNGGGTRTITLILSAASVAVPLVAGAAAFMQQQITNSERTVAQQVATVAAATAGLHERIASLEVARLDSEHADGEADITRTNNVKAIADLQAAIVDLDNRLQREYRDLNAGIVAESRAVDQRLQGEINLHADQLAAHVAAADARFLRIEAILSDRAERIAHMEERIVALEREMYPVSMSDERK